MINGLKLFIKKIIFGNSNLVLAKLIKSGIVSVEKNNDIDNLNIEVRFLNKTNPMVKIGNNNVLNTKFVLETKTSKITVGNNSFVGGGVFVCANEITIGSDVMFSWGCTIIDTDAHSLNWEYRKDDVKNWKRGLDENAIGKYKDWTNVVSKKIEIQDKAWIGFNVIILKGVTIGEGAIVAAGSVVTKNVDPFTLVAGNPAVFIKKLN